jgi:hypothetical protein
VSDVTEVESAERYLVHDELEEIYSRSGRSFQFRFRVWRGKHQTSIVLVSQYGDSVQPSKMVTKLLNYAYKALLRYPPEGVHFFIDNLEISGIRKLYQVYYSKWGCEQRCQLVDPIERERSWQMLSVIVGQQVKP